jgi:uroporphyrinogen-III decarboxylase
LKVTDVPVMCFAKSCGHSLEELGKCAYDGYSLDWSVGREEARAAVGPNKSLQVFLIDISY